MPRLSRAAVRERWDDLWDRFSASDPGLIRLSNALTTVGGVLLTLLALSLLGTPVRAMVIGALTAMACGFGISDPRPREQAVTLALALPVSILTLTLGALLAPYRAAADLVFLALIFTAVYIRRFGPRGTGLGLISFQLFFVSQFAHATPEQLPSLCGILAIAVGSAAVIRFGLVRATPERTMRRLRRAFRARLGGVVDALVEVARTEPGTPAADRAALALNRHTARLHACALMIQARLESGTDSPRTAALVQRRIAEAEIAAERLGVLLLRALRPDPDNVTTLALHLPAVLLSGSGASGSGASGSGAPASGPDGGAGDGTGADEARPPGPADPVVTRLVRELRALRLLVARPVGTRAGTGLAVVRDRLLGYRDDARIPEQAAGTVQEVYRAIGELARAMLGLRLALGGDQDDSQDPPATARSREELEAEDLSLEADEAAPAEQTGLRRPTTRAAVQVAVGSALAITGGELLSSQRWYWAVLTCWVVFLNTSSVGEILMKGYRRLAGTMAGVVAGIGLAALVAGHLWTTFALMVLCIFGAFFTAPVSYLLMSFFITAMVGLLYTLLGTYSPSVLVLRIEETALGAAAGLIAGVLVLPVHTGRRTDEQLVEVLERMREVLLQAVSQLTGGPAVDLLESARELDTALDGFRTALQPLTHPASPLRNRRRRVRYVLGILETCAYHARSLAATAELVPGNLRILADPRLGEVGRRIDRNLAALAVFVRSEGRKRQPLESGPSAAALIRGVTGAGNGGSAPENTVAVRVLRHLHRLDEGVQGLARPLGLPVERD